MTLLLYSEKLSLVINIDVPAIISSDKIAYLDPQEKLWTGQSGRYFNLSDDRTRRCLSPFHGIAD